MPKEAFAPPRLKLGRLRRVSVAAACLALLACSERSGPPVNVAAAPAGAAAKADPQPAIADSPAEAGIAWKRASSDADVDAAFAQAKAEGKPVFVYWGAKWCPPCNQLQATLFNRHDFIERSRAFVPVYVDGDSPGAQKLGARFKVRGYPSMLLFDAQATELTRLPGEVDAEQYTQVLTLGMSAQRPVKAVLADAQAGGDAARRLSANDWRLLAFYSWETDEQQLVPKEQLPDLLSQLAQACPPEQALTAQRLQLKAVATAPALSALPNPPDGKPTATTRSSAATAPDAQSLARLMQWLADPAIARAHMDVLSNRAADLTNAATLPGTPQRQQWVMALSAALQGLAADSTLSRADRMMAVIAQVDLARIGLARGAQPQLPEPLLVSVRDHAARADRDITNGYERQAVITTAAYMLQLAGLSGESDALLKANLEKSHSPYYLMTALGSNAKARGDSAEALGWYEKAFDQSVGPATRLQWGASYLGALVELAPQDEARIEKAASQLWSEAAAQTHAFHERSARSLQRVGTRLQVWNQGGKHAAVIKRLQQQLDGVCQKIDPADSQRQVCEGLLNPATKPAGQPA